MANSNGSKKLAFLSLFLLGAVAGAQTKPAEPVALSPCSLPGVERSVGCGVIEVLEDQWESPEGQIIESCSILTTAANSVVADLHDRMAVIVPPDKYDVWLDPEVNDFNVIRDILRPYDANRMRRYPVSRKLNNARIDDAESASPVILDTPTQAKLF